MPVAPTTVNGTLSEAMLIIVTAYSNTTGIEQAEGLYEVRIVFVGPFVVGIDTAKDDTSRAVNPYVQSNAPVVLP